VARDHAVAVRAAGEHAEVRVAVLDEAVELRERPRVEERLDALARGPLATLPLTLDRLRIAGLDALDELVEVPEPLRGGAGQVAILLDGHRRGIVATCPGEGLATGPARPPGASRLGPLRGREFA
jgi:hypothetical protein